MIYSCTTENMLLQSNIYICYPEWMIILQIILSIDYVTYNRAIKDINLFEELDKK